MEKTYSTREVADILNVSIHQIYSWENLGKIRSIRTATNRRLFKQKQVDRLLKSKKNLKLTVTHTVPMHTAPLNKPEPTAPVVHPVVSQNKIEKNDTNPAVSYYNLSEAMHKIKIAYNTILVWGEKGILTPHHITSGRKFYDAAQVDAIAKYKDANYSHLIPASANKALLSDTIFMFVVCGKTPDVNTEAQIEESPGPTPVAIEYAATDSPIYDEHFDEYDDEYEHAGPLTADDTLVEDGFPADKYYKTMGVQAMLGISLKLLSGLVKKGTLKVFTDSRNYNYYLKEQVDALCGRSHFVSKRIKSRLTGGYLYPAVEIMARFGMARCTLTVWERSGALVPVFKKGRKAFYSESQINNFIKPKYGEGNLFFSNVEEEKISTNTPVPSLTSTDPESAKTATNMVDEALTPQVENLDSPISIFDDHDQDAYVIRAFIQVGDMPCLWDPVSPIKKQGEYPNIVHVTIPVYKYIEKHCFLNGQCTVKPGQEIKVFTLDEGKPLPVGYMSSTHMPGYMYTIGDITRVTVEYVKDRITIYITANLH